MSFLGSSVSVVWFLNLWIFLLSIYRCFVCLCCHFASVLDHRRYTDLSRGLHVYCHQGALKSDHVCAVVGLRCGEDRSHNLQRNDVGLKTFAETIENNENCVCDTAHA